MAQAGLARWFILGLYILVRHAADALGDPNLDLKLPLDSAPPGITRLTALTGVGAVRGQLSIVGTSNGDLLFHEHGRPTEPDNPNIFFLAIGTDFMPDERAYAAGRRVFEVAGTRLLDRTPGLPHFSGARNVGFLSLRGVRGRKSTYVVAELQASNLENNAVRPFITCRTPQEEEDALEDEDDDALEDEDDEEEGERNPAEGHHALEDDEDDDEEEEEWEWNQADLHWPVVDDEENPHWTTHDVIAHANRLWWVNLSRGLVACDPVPAGNLLPTLEFVPLPVLNGFEVRHEPKEHIDRYRVVGVSAGEMRFVDVARRQNDPEGQTRVVVWTLDLPQLLVNGAAQAWAEDRQTTLADIWNSANYGQMPQDRVPVVALVDPIEPAVVYFFLDQFVFSVDVNQSAVVHVAVMPDQQDGVPRPINQRGVLTWECSTSFKVVTLQEVYDKTEDQAQYDEVPADG